MQTLQVLNCQIDFFNYKLYLIIFHNKIMNSWYSFYNSSNKIFENYDKFLLMYSYSFEKDKETDTNIIEACSETSNGFGNFKWYFWGH